MIFDFLPWLLFDFNFLPWLIFLDLGCFFRTLAVLKEDGCLFVIGGTQASVIGSLPMLSCTLIGPNYYDAFVRLPIPIGY